MDDLDYIYRGWRVWFAYPPIPFRGADWQATHPDFDGPEDNRFVQGNSRIDVEVAIDEWIEENDEGEYDRKIRQYAMLTYIVAFGLVLVGVALIAFGC